MSRPSASPFRIVHAELSDRGMRRANNQDSVAASEPGKDRDGQPGQLFVVADGMGAHAAGELASKLAVDCIPHAYRKRTDQPPQAALRHAVREANAQIHAKGQSGLEFQGMGTTCSSLVLLADAALVAHVGDSRVYRLRDGKLEQLTFDHSLVWELAAASQTTAEQVPACIPKNVITRSLGPHEQVNVDLEGPYQLADGDVFLICSDGLTGVVEDQVIGAILGAMPPEEAGQTLIDLANLRGGPDNISTVIARVSADSNESSEFGSVVLEPQSSSPSVRNVAPGTWLSLLACLSALVWFSTQMHPLGALLASAGFGATVVVALMQRNGSANGSHSMELGGPYGDGPYRTINCQSGGPATEAIGKVVEELAQLEGRVESDGFQPPIEDWSDFNQLRLLGVRAADQQDHPEAIKQYGAAICALMDQVRENHTIEYP